MLPELGGWGRGSLGSARKKTFFSVEVFPEKGWSELLVEDELCFVSFHVSHQIMIPAVL